MSAQYADFPHLQSFARGTTTASQPSLAKPAMSIRVNKSSLEANLTASSPKEFQLDNNLKKSTEGKFGKHGGKYVPETLISCLSELEAQLKTIATDTQFQRELADTLRDYVGRETPLYFAERLTKHYRNAEGEGPLIYLKREDLNHEGAHKINNAIGQAMVAREMGRRRVVAATGAGQHGVATAAACARLSLQCVVYMGNLDMDKQPSNVLHMKLLGAEVKSVEGNLKDATSESIRDWVGNLETSFYLSGTVAGPHPCPTMVRNFQSVIGKETRKQALEKWGGKPDVLVACVGSGSNAMGLFHEFVEDEEVRLIGVEAGGLGLDTGRHSATLSTGDVGVYHGTMSYLLQDQEGQILNPHSIGVGLEYPGAGPELSFLKDIGRAEFYAVTDREALEAYRRLSLLEGIIPALETSHALAYLEKLCPTLSHGSRLVVNCSGRGDKDAVTCFNILHK
ncbi:tryptophan synthase beta chain 1-like isoform X2 [Aristolochia californica]|uniref:tryptophan synthase beta chain 1-like isoform X2 n=1 Tax=Aristolochia californica TaxID=171875 RepID=UPI0035DA18C2